MVSQSALPGKTKTMMSNQGDSGTWGTPAQMNATRAGGAKQLAAYKAKPAFTPAGNANTKQMLTKPKTLGGLKQYIASKLKL